METVAAVPGMTPQSASDSERARLALEGSDLGVWDWHLGENIVAWDARCREMLGLPDDNASALGKAMEIVHPDDRAALEAAMARAVDPAVLSPMAGEFRVLHP